MMKMWGVKGVVVGQVEAWGRRMEEVKGVKEDEEGRVRELEALLAAKDAEVEELRRGVMDTRVQDDPFYLSFYR